jgi:arsenite methyltransferase
MTTAQSSSQSTGRRRGHYGLDSPSTVIGFTLGIIASGIGGGLTVAYSGGPDAIWPLVVCGFLILCLAVYLHATLSGKFRVWRDLLDSLGLTGREKVLDLGCGRGAVLFMVARRLSAGRASGVDIWQRRDQSGNGEEAAQANAEAEGVADRVELKTADMTDLPFGKARFDLVVSNLAIHNIRGAEDRQKALDEALRVLRPGGRLAVVDIAHVPAYAAHLTESGATDVAVRSLGWRMWWGGPWVRSRVVTATKPGKSR